MEVPTSTISHRKVRTLIASLVPAWLQSGFTVENVIDAQPADGDSAHVVLKLAKGGERRAVNAMNSTAVSPRTSASWWYLPRWLPPANQSPPSQPATPAATVEGLMRVQDSAIAVRSGAWLTNSLARTIPAGSTVRLSGLNQSDWAELAEGGWIAIHSLATDPRLS